MLTEEDKLAAIESRFTTMLVQLKQLSQENTFLKNKVADLTKTKAIMAERMNKAKTEVKLVLGQLKEQLRE